MQMSPLRGSELGRHTIFYTDAAPTGLWKIGEVRKPRRHQKNDQKPGIGIHSYENRYRFSVFSCQFSVIKSIDDICICFTDCRQPTAMKRRESEFPPTDRRDGFLSQFTETSRRIFSCQAVRGFVRFNIRFSVKTRNITKITPVFWILRCFDFLPYPASYLSSCSFLTTSVVLNAAVLKSLGKNLIGD